MREKMNVLSVGIGLMGGSMAAAIKKSMPSWKIFGFDTDINTGQLALKGGFIDEIVMQSEIDRFLKTTDLVLLGTPILDIISFLDEYRHSFNEGTIIIDLGSTKKQIVEAMDRLPENVQAIGGHPMTGKQTAGVVDSDANLFKDKVFVLTPSARTQSNTMRFANELLASIGAKPIEIAPTQHDFIVALVSHLPYLLPCLLINSANRGNDPLAWQVAAGGFKSIAQSAGNNVPMWRDILNTNNLAILQVIELLEEEIRELKKRLENNTLPGYQEYLESSAKLKENY